jgi:hypothetical protein
MDFRISFNRVQEEKIGRLAKLTGTRIAAHAFWHDLANALKELKKHATVLGEPVFDYKHGKYQCRLWLAGAIAIQFSVNEQHRSVVVQRLSISGICPYPSEVEEVLNNAPF